MSDFEPLVDGESQLENEDEQVWRQCAPGHFDEATGKPTADMFWANDSDAGKLSAARSTKSTAEQAYKHRTEVEKKESKGTWGVTVEEIQSVGSRAVDDSALLPADAPPGHVYIDQRHLDKGGRRRLRSTLLIRANNRGRQHPA